jgi:hypothetical protein
MAPVPGTTTAAPLTTELGFNIPMPRLLAAAMITVATATPILEYLGFPLEVSSNDGMYFFYCAKGFLSRRNTSEEVAITRTSAMVISTAPPTTPTMMAAKSPPEMTPAYEV